MYDAKSAALVKADGSYHLIPDQLILHVYLPPA